MRAGAATTRRQTRVWLMCQQAAQGRRRGGEGGRDAKILERWGERAEGVGGVVRFGGELAFEPLAFFGGEPRCIGGGVGEEEEDEHADGDAGEAFEEEEPLPAAQVGDAVELEEQ